MTRPGAFLRSVIARLRPKDHRPRVVRRVTISCPAGKGRVEVDLLMGYRSTPEQVLRCSIRDECPPACGQPCRFLSEAIAGPPTALILLPPGTTPPHEQD